MFKIISRNVKDMLSKIISKTDERDITRCLWDNYFVRINPGSKDYVDGIVYQSFHVAIFKSDKCPADRDNEFFEYSFKVDMVDDYVGSLEFDFESTEKYRQDMDKIRYLYNFNIEKFNSLMMKIAEKIYNILNSDTQKKSDDYYEYLVKQLD